MTALDGRAGELAERLHGGTTVLVTPYRGGISEVAYDVLGDLVRRSDEAGIPVITALGNTAEVHQLDADERLLSLRAVADARRDAALLAGLTGSAREAI